MTDYIRAYWLKFLKYSGFGILAFSFELLLLVTFVEQAQFSYRVAVPTAFLIATSLQYIAIRTMVFHETMRYTGHGIVYFFLVMGTNAFLTTTFVTGLVEVVDASLYPARIGVGIVLGILSFFLHAQYNSKPL